MRRIGDKAESRADYDLSFLDYDNLLSTRSPYHVQDAISKIIREKKEGRHDAQIPIQNHLVRNRTSIYRCFYFDTKQKKSLRKHPTSALMTA